MVYNPLFTLGPDGVRGSLLKLNATFHLPDTIPEEEAGATEPDQAWTNHGGAGEDESGSQSEGGHEEEHDRQGDVQVQAGPLRSRELTSGSAQEGMLSTVTAAGSSPSVREGADGSQQCGTTLADVTGKTPDLAALSTLDVTIGNAHQVNGPHTTPSAGRSLRVYEDTDGSPQGGAHADDDPTKQSAAIVSHGSVHSALP
jgi:hypothetical protein